MAYTEVTLEQASEVIKKAGYGDLASIEKLDGGWANSNYKLVLKNNTKLVLKIWNEQDENQVNYLLNITSYLAKSGVPTPSPIVFDNGSYLIMRDGLPWTILPFVEGSWLKSDYESLYSLAKIQAEMHLITPPINLKSDFSMGISLFEKLFNIANENNEWTEFLLLLKSSRSLYHNIENLNNNHITTSSSVSNRITEINSLNEVVSLWKWFIIFALIFLAIELLILKYL